MFLLTPCAEISQHKKQLNFHLQCYHLQCFSFARPESRPHPFPPSLSHVQAKAPTIVKRVMLACLHAARLERSPLLPKSLQVTEERWRRRLGGPLNRLNATLSLLLPPPPHSYGISLWLGGAISPCLASTHTGRSSQPPPCRPLSQPHDCGAIVGNFSERVSETLWEEDSWSLLSLINTEETQNVLLIMVNKMLSPRFCREDLGWIFFWGPSKS